jgi:pimeloyl-ACP methyl ester carboxylesterase
MTSLDVAVAPLEFVDFGGYCMAYRQWGDRNATDAAVLVHGITSSSLSWIRVAPRLAERSRVIAVDLKGHGDSGRPSAGYRIQDQAEEVAGLVRALGLRSITVTGHSWGGAIAVVLATSHDLAISRLVLEDPAIDTRERDPLQRQERIDNFVGSVGLTPEAANERVRATLAPGWTEEDIYGKIDSSVKGSPASVRAVFEENGPWNTLDRLPELRVPTLLVRAEVANGGIVPEHAVAVARSNPVIQVVTLPQADHNVHRGQFEAFMRLIEPFLTSAAGPDGARS